MAEKIAPPVEGKDAPATDTPGLDELLILGPEPEDMYFKSLDKTFSLTPMRMKQIRQFLNIGKDVLPHLEGIAGEFSKSGELDLASLSSLDGDALVTVVAIASRIPVNELDELDPVEFVTLVGKLLVMNIDFFGQSLPKVFQQVGASVIKSMAKTQVGPSLSKS